MIIVYAATRNLYRKLPRAMRSLLSTNDPEKIILLIEDDAMPEDIRLPDVCEIVNAVPYRDRYLDPRGPNYHGWFSWQAMLRVAYAEIFWQYDRILSLDVDTIVCDDLRQIWEADLTGRWLAAVPEMEPPTWRSKPFSPDVPYYINAGVMVMNLRQLRAVGVTRRLVRFVNYVPADYIEQDAFNQYGMRAGKIKLLPTRYNECIGCGYTDDPAVVHFAGVQNKWEVGAQFFRHEYMERWTRPEDFGPEFAEC